VHHPRRGGVGPVRSQARFAFAFLVQTHFLAESVPVRKRQSRSFLLRLRQIHALLFRSARGRERRVATVGFFFSRQTISFGAQF
jgi:hypothetical protein